MLSFGLKNLIFQGPRDLAKDFAKAAIKSNLGFCFTPRALGCDAESLDLTQEFDFEPAAHRPYFYQCELCLGL